MRLRVKDSLWDTCEMFSCQLLLNGLNPFDVICELFLFEFLGSKLVLLVPIKGRP